MTGILLVVDEPGWRRSRGLLPKLKRAALAAAKKGGLGGDFSITVLLSSDAKLRTLNRRFRGRDKPTNVLSFPARPNRDNTLGDIAMALGVTSREAKRQGKSLADHAVHLTVHGVLHLAGHDHVKRSEARKMEGLEIAILDKLGIANPYEVRP